MIPMMLPRLLLCAGLCGGSSVTTSSSAAAAPPPIANLTAGWVDAVPLRDTPTVS